jgi:3-phosphoshikimate 1-carboxyvinyltransferase
MTSLSSEKSNGLKGTVKIPGDKSISHRSLMLGAIADGKTTVSGLLMGEDVLCTAKALGKMGVDISLPETEADDAVIHGVGLNGFVQPQSDLDMGNSGTSTRLLMGLIAGHDISVRFVGDASLSKRPMKRVTDPVSQMGARFKSQGDKMQLPLDMVGTKDVKPIHYELPVASAQVKSAIILAGLYSDGVTEVIEPKPTRDHSENMLRNMGADITVDGPSIKIRGGRTLKPCHINVPSDPSSAAFITVAALITPNSEVYMPNVGMNPRRDGLYKTLVEMGADITFENEREEAGERVVDLRVKSSALKGIDVPADRAPSMIDEYPILFVAASCADGETYMPGLHELRVKESDRLGVMAQGLSDCGVKLELGDDDLRIFGGGKPPKGGALVKTHLDHRIAMSFLVLGLVTDEPIKIDDVSPVYTSFPNFTQLMTDLGAVFT